MAIRYVSISDMHLGEEDSLLTNVSGARGKVDPSSASPVLIALSECLRSLLSEHGTVSPRPTLILNGDLLELALASPEQAIAVFTQFLSLVMPEGGELFDEIIYIPGNHDHHLWETAREAQYLNHIRRLPLEAVLDPPWHTTKALMDMAGKDRLVHDFLTAIAHRLPHLRRRGFQILAAYPNFGVARTSDGGERCVVFHHGHFIEPLYQLMSSLVSLVFPDQPNPANVYELEGENSGWIDFFWSALGSCGRVGEDLETIYEATGDSRSLQRLTDTLARSIAAKYDIPLLAPDWTEEHVLKLLLRKEVVERLAAKQERQRRLPENTAVPLSATAEENLAWYAGNILRAQLRREHGRVPELAAFVFGHTHKPFETAGPLPAINTGGWVVDTVEPDPHHGGAVAVVDEDLNAVNIRMYDECLGPIRAEEPRRVHSALYGRVSESILAGGPWTAFSAEVEDALRVREKCLKTRLDCT